MKKLLAIVVLGLMFSGNAYSDIAGCIPALDGRRVYVKNSFEQWDWFVKGEEKNYWVAEWNDERDEILYVYQEGDVIIELFNPSSKIIKITNVKIFTKKNKILKEEKKNYVLEPFSKRHTIGLKTSNLMTKLADHIELDCKILNKLPGKGNAQKWLDKIKGKK